MPVTRTRIVGKVTYSCPAAGVVTSVALPSETARGCMIRVEENPPAHLANPADDWNLPIRCRVDFAEKLDSS
jgi:hypothetical protein